MASTSLPGPMLHNDVEIRAAILMKFAGQEAPVNGYLDMSIEDFNKLAELEVEVDA